MEKITFSWFCPSYGPGANGQRMLEIPEIIAAASIAEKNGFKGILTPADSNCLDPWILSSAILQSTKYIKTIIAIRTGFIAPIYAARMVATLNKLYNNRISLNIVSGGSKIELAKEGSHLNHVERYERSYEYVEILTNMFNSGGPYSFEGYYHKLVNSTLYPEIPQEEIPKMYIAGSSVAAKRIAEDFKATYLTWAQPVNSIINALDYFKSNFNNFALRINILVRETREEAIETAKKNGIIKPHKDSQRLLQLINKHSDSEGQKKLTELAMAQDKYDSCLYTTSILGKTGNVPTLVGSSDEVLESIMMYVNLGISDFIISSIDNDLEINHIGEKIIKKIRSWGNNI